MISDQIALSMIYYNKPIFSYVLRIFIPQKTLFTEVFHSGATGVTAAVHVEAEFVIAIAIATIPGPKMAEETVVDQRQRQGDVTCTLAQVNSLINGRRFL